MPERLNHALNIACCAPRNNRKCMRAAPEGCRGRDSRTASALIHSGNSANFSLGDRPIMMTFADNTQVCTTFILTTATEELPA